MGRQRRVKSFGRCAAPIRGRIHVGALGSATHHDSVFHGLILHIVSNFVLLLNDYSNAEIFKFTLITDLILIILQNFSGLI